MTRSQQQQCDVAETLLRLYEGTDIDLTSEGYQRAMKRLRESNPTEARRVERRLGPFLQQRIFRRRQLAWHTTSEGMRARVALLPHNPHVQADVAAIRQALGIPDACVHATEDDPVWKELGTLVEPPSLKRVVEGNLAGWWFHVHRRAAMGKMQDDEADEGMLPMAMRESALSSAAVCLSGSNAPEWLRRPPAGPEPYNNPPVPIDWVTGRLVERHRLPWHLAGPLRFYILTQDADWVTDLDHQQVSISYTDDACTPEAFTVSIKGVDEFMTREDWERIWVKNIKPGQEHLWEQRGMKPQGRRAGDIGRLRTALPLYCEMIRTGLTVQSLLYRKSPLPLAMTDWDSETVRRVVRDLRDLLTPTD